MAIGLGSLVKMARGGMGTDELGPMLRALGVDISFTPVAVDAAAFRDLAVSASAPGARLVKLSGKLKDGSEVSALLVLNQA